MRMLYQLTQKHPLKPLQAEIIQSSPDASARNGLIASLTFRVLISLGAPTQMSNFNGCYGYAADNGSFWRKKPQMFLL
jgi:hypothetical protein